MAKCVKRLSEAIFLTILIPVGITQARQQSKLALFNGIRLTAYKKGPDLSEPLAI